VKPDDLTEALFSTIHEAGHALYELGVDEGLLTGPLGHGASSGVHESQSRLWENIVARGLIRTDAAERAMPDLEVKIAEGEFHFLREWLRDNLHRHGRKFQGDDLITRATGQPLAATDYLSYLNKKCRDLLAVEPKTKPACNPERSPSQGPISF
jgi:Zn-dependent M32 family carboxypeptidase